MTAGLADLFFGGGDLFSASGVYIYPLTVKAHSGNTATLVPCSASRCSLSTIRRRFSATSNEERNCTAATLSFREAVCGITEETMKKGSKSLSKRFRLMASLRISTSKLMRTSEQTSYG